MLLDLVIRLRSKAVCILSTIFVLQYSRISKRIRLSHYSFDQLAKVGKESYCSWQSWAFLLACFGFWMMKSPFRLLDMGFSIPISTSRTMSILIVSQWNGGIRNGGVWYGFSSLLICSSCQAPSVRYNNSSHWRVNVARHFALALVGACKDCLWQLLASLPSHTWYKVVVSFTFFLRLCIDCIYNST